jgi:ribosome maturation factor RimP
LRSDRVNEVVEPVVEALGYELILLEFVPQSRSAVLRVFIDCEDGITLADCQKVSRELSAVMDVEDPIKTAYQLEVSSPGLDRPLTKRRHFDRFAGEKARIQLVAPLAGGTQKKFVGRITGTTDEGVKLETETGSVELAFAAIERARLGPDYSKAAKAGRAQA